MEYRRLGRWGVKLSELGFGSWLTLDDGDQERGDRLFQTAYENGINFFDTSNAYGRGETEMVVGRSLTPFRRDTYVLGTKAFWPFDRNWPFRGANDRGLSRKHLFEQCHASLRRLNTDYIDLYQCHRFDPETPLDETCGIMHDLINQGKVLYWGVSEWTADQIRDACDICTARGWHLPASNQPLYNMLERHWEAEVFPECERHGLGIVNFSPLCEGLLTGKYCGGVPPGSRGSDDKVGRFLLDRMSQENLQTVSLLGEVASDLGVPLPVLALRWCLRRNEITSTITGATSPEQILQNLAAVDLTLDPSTLSRIDDILHSPLRR
jgi:aryl-alcohol dehydrogenase-like predicted oxidoreductase